VTRISPRKAEDAGKPWTEVANDWRMVDSTSLTVFHALNDAGLLSEEARTLGYSVYNLILEAT
jgi:hypothetical protein